MVPPPYDDHSLRVIRSHMSVPCVLVFDGVTQADLDAPWLNCAAAELQGQHTSTSGTCFADITLSPDFRLVLLAGGAEARSIRLSAHMKTATQFTSFCLLRRNVSDAMAQTASEFFNPILTDCASLKNEMQQLQDAEEALPNLAKDEVNKASGLVQRTEQACSQVQHYKAQRRRSSAYPKNYVGCFKKIGRICSMVMYVCATTFSKISPGSCYTAQFYYTAIKRVLRETLASSKDGCEDDSDADMQYSDDMLLPILLHRVSLSCADHQQKLLLAFLTFMEKAYRTEWYSGQASCVRLRTMEMEGSREQVSRLLRLKSKPAPRRKRSSTHNCVASNASEEDSDAGFSFSEDQPCPQILRSLEDLVVRDLNLSTLHYNFLETQTFSERHEVDAISTAVAKVSALVPLLVIAHEDLFLPRMKAIVREKDRVRSTFFVTSAPSQKAMARSLIKDATVDGAWIVITDLVNSVSFAREMTDIVTVLLPSLSASKVHRDFKLIIQTQALPSLPHLLVERCTKIGLQGPSGLKARLQCALLALEDYVEQPASTARMNSPRKLELLAVYLRCVVLLHAMIMERQSRGWLQGRGEGFTSDDLTRGVASLIAFLRSNGPSLATPSAIRHVTAVITYGVRLGSHDDVAALEAMAGRVFGPLGETTVLEDAAAYTFHGRTFNLTHELGAFVEALPDGNAPEVMLNVMY